MAQVGCEKRTSAPSTSSVPTQSQVGAGTAVDWAGVAGTADGSEILASKTLARYCDAWHRGGAPSITLRFVAPSSFSDDAGHTADLGPGLLNAAIWKGIAARARRPNGEAVPAVASLSNFYQSSTPGMPSDDFGVIPRYRYTIEVVDAGTYRFKNAGKQDDGK